MSNIPEEYQEALINAGWRLVDLRLLSEVTQDDKEFAVKAWFQGIRQGSIVPPRGGVHWAEVEARVYGLMANKRPEKPKGPMNTEDLEGILGPLAVKQGKK